MRLLLIAYEFPPSPSPQSLRWTYLARELSKLGHEIHVLTADLGGETPGLPILPESIHVHRTFPGLLRGALALHRKYRRKNARRILQAQRTPLDRQAGGDAAPGAPLRPPRNWKQRVSERVQAIAAYAHFPDIRGEWRHWGRKALRKLMAELDPDLVISSHEPATTLELGRLAVEHGKPWIADLGDPVLASYTPDRWKGRSRSVEAMTCRDADAIIVTSDATRELLRERHARTGNVHVLTQGFDRSPDLPGIVSPFDSRRLELLYTGSLYAFRRIDCLLSAIAAAPRVRLNIASVTVPEQVLQLARRMPLQVRLLGFMPHTTVLELQRLADILVNIANQDPAQIPGKFYEYLGSQRPILHLGPPVDSVAAQIRELKRGWTCRNDAGRLAELLGTLSHAHEQSRLEAGLELGMDPIVGYSWQSLARRLDREILQPLR